MFWDLISAFIPALGDGATRLSVYSSLRAMTLNPLRRLLALALSFLVAAPDAAPRAAVVVVAAVVAMATTAAQAQGVPVYDNALFMQAQQIAQKQDFKKELQHKESEASANYRWARQIAASYNEALGLYSQYKRLNGSITLGVAQLLPMLPYTLRGRGRYTDETTVIRPVLTPGASEQWNIRRPRVNVKWQNTSVSDLVRMLSFDVTSTKSPTPDSAKTAQQIAEDAIRDGWMIFSTAQKKYGVPQQYWDIADPELPQDPYAGLREEAKNIATYRMSELVSASADAAQRFGPDSVEVRELDEEIAKIHQAATIGQDPGRVDEAEKALLRLDADAQLAIERYAYLRAELAHQTKRDEAKDKNLQELAAADADWQPFTLTEYFSGDKKGDKQAKRRDSTKTREHLKSAAETAAQQLRAQLDRDMRDAAGQIEAVAAKKQAILNKLLAEETNKLATVRMAAINRDLDVKALIWRLKPIYQNLEKVAIKPMPSEVIEPIPGTTKATPGAVATANANKATEDAVASANDILGEWQKSLGSANLGILAPVLSAIDQAIKASTGKSLNLSNWAWAKEPA